MSVINSTKFDNIKIFFKIYLYILKNNAGKFKNFNENIL